MAVAVAFAAAVLQRHYFANKGPSSQAMVFPVVMYGCESGVVSSGWARGVA